MSVGLVNFDYNIFEKVAEELAKEQKISYCFGYVLPKKKKSLSKIKYEGVLKFFDYKSFNTSLKQNFYFSKEEEYIFFKIFDRLSFNSHNNYLKKKFFQKLTSYWFEFLTNNSNLKILFFSSVPHTHWDFALYCVAKKLKIKTYFYSRTSISDLIYFKKDFIQYDKNIIKINKQKNIINFLLLNWKNHKYILKDNNLSYLGNLHSKTRTFRFHAICKIKIVFHLYIFYRNSHELISRSISPLPIQDKILSYNSIPSTIFSIYKKKLNRFNYILYLLKYSVKNCILNLKDYYEKKNINFFHPLKKKKYIFFPLHFQPERTTLPEGWRYSDQLSAIKILSKSLPLNWQIIVKEHPRQLSFDLRNYHYRDLNFYRKLKSIPRVIYLSSDANYDEILKKCDVTATITGSVCTEGIFLNKPSVIFGQTWLMNVKKIIHLYKNVNELKKFLNNCIKISSQTFNLEIQNFFKHKNSFFYEGSTFDGYWNFFNEKTKKKLVNSTAKVLENVINQK